jgi:ankyrin repeat protein
LDLFPGTINTRYPGLHGFSQVHIAMRRGDLAALQMLLLAGADANAQDLHGNTPIMYWPVAPRVPEECVVALLGRLLAHVS